MTPTVRDARLADLETLVAFTIAEAAEAEGVEIAAETIRTGVRAGLEDHSVSRYWVLESASDEALGSISVVREWSDWRAGYFWWIQSIYLAPDYRGQGLMVHLLEAVRTAAREEGALELRLYVHGGNTRALRAYEKAGFSHSDYRIMRMGI